MQITLLITLSMFNGAFAQGSYSRIVYDNNLMKMADADPTKDSFMYVEYENANHYRYPCLFHFENNVKEVVYDQNNRKINMCYVKGTRELTSIDRLATCTYNMCNCPATFQNNCAPPIVYQTYYIPLTPNSGEILETKGNLNKRKRSAKTINTKLIDKDLFKHEPRLTNSFNKPVKKSRSLKRGIDKRNRQHTKNKESTGSSRDRYPNFHNNYHKKHYLLNDNNLYPRRIKGQSTYISHGTRNNRANTESYPMLIKKNRLQADVKRKHNLINILEYVPNLSRHGYPRKSNTHKNPLSQPKLRALHKRKADYDNTALSEERDPESVLANIGEDEEPPTSIEGNTYDPTEKGDSDDDFDDTQDISNNDQLSSEKKSDDLTNFNTRDSRSAEDAIFGTDNNHNSFYDFDSQETDFIPSEDETGMLDTKTLSDNEDDEGDQDILENDEDEYAENFSVENSNNYDTFSDTDSDELAVVSSEKETENASNNGPSGEAEASKHSNSNTTASLNEAKMDSTSMELGAASNIFSSGSSVAFDSKNTNEINLKNKLESNYEESKINRSTYLPEEEINNRNDHFNYKLKSREDVLKLMKRNPPVQINQRPSHLQRQPSVVGLPNIGNSTTLLSGIAINLSLCVHNLRIAIESFTLEYTRPQKTYLLINLDEAMFSRLMNQSTDYIEYHSIEYNSDKKCISGDASLFIDLVCLRILEREYKSPTKLAEVNSCISLRPLVIGSSCISTTEIDGYPRCSYLNTMSKTSFDGLVSNVKYSLVDTSPSNGIIGSEFMKGMITTGIGFIPIVGSVAMVFSDAVLDFFDSGTDVTTSKQPDIGESGLLQDALEMYENLKRIYL